MPLVRPSIPKWCAGYIPIDNNVVVTVGAEAYQRSPEHFAQAIEKSMTNQQKIAAAKAGVDVLAPARAQAAGLELKSEDGGAVEVVSSSTTRRIPASVDTKDHSEDVTYEGGQA